jgi:hypothetical protein
MFSSLTNLSTSSITHNPVGFNSFRLFQIMPATTAILPKTPHDGLIHPTFDLDQGPNSGGTRKQESTQ